MILGILSDTHGCSARTAHAIRVLQEAGAEAFVHCGDIGSEAVFDQLAGLPAWFVWGNSDTPGPILKRYVQSLGLTLPEEIPLWLELAGKSLIVFHGHEPQFHPIAELHRIGDSQRLKQIIGADYLLFGHSHVAFNERIDSFRAINPGALHRARPYTVATLDLTQDIVRFWQITDDEHTRPLLSEWHRNA